MSVSFFVLWIPQFTKEDPQILQQKLTPKVLRDNRNIEPLYVHAHILPESRNIILSYRIGNGSDNVLTFDYIRQDDRGFLIYKLELGDQQNDFLCTLLRTEMPNALYHYFKSFFHEHIFHDESEDSLLSPYYSVEPIDWDNVAVRNDIVERLIADYEVKFQGAIEEYSAIYNEIIEQLKGNKKILRLKSLMDELCEQEMNTLNERAYCEFLLRSFPLCIDVERKRKLRNAIKHLEMINLKLESSRNRVSASLGLHFSILGFWVGIAGITIGLITSLASLIYAVHQSKSSAKEEDQNMQVILNTIQQEAETTRQEEGLVLDKVQYINDRLDTLDYKVNKIQQKLKK